ncbi:MAG TPA: hypothetical protein P5191_01270 [Ruminococcus sp.]|nr:hypothetical protein [Ruminococcus sp.]
MIKEIALLAASALLLTGCGKSDPGTDNDSSDVIVTVESTGETSETETETDTTDPTETETDTTDTSEENTEEETSEEQNTEDTDETDVEKPSDAVYSSSEIDKSVFYKLSLGMSGEEVFAITGKDYQNDVDKGFLHMYEWYLTDEDIFGTGLSGVFSIEISSDDTLSGFGYELGRESDPEFPEFPELFICPHTPEELDAAYNKVISCLESEYGAPNGTVPSSFFGTVKQQDWETSAGKVTALYGISLWMDSPVDEYEHGYNEVVIRCSND